VNSGDAEFISKTIDEVFDPDLRLATPLPVDATGAQALKRVWAILVQLRDAALRQQGKSEAEKRKDPLRSAWSQLGGSAEVAKAAPTTNWWPSISNNAPTSSRRSS
jgi:hypothetical protein